MRKSVVLAGWATPFLGVLLGGAVLTETVFSWPGIGRLMVESIQRKDTPMVKLETSMGDIILELDEEKAPKTTANFLEYVKSGHYDGTIFHRVIPNFMIQGGGFNEKMVQAEDYEFWMRVLRAG